MENATDALEMAFAVFVFVVALTVALVVFAKVRNTADIVMTKSDKTNYYTYEDELGIEEGDPATGQRIVGVETIIPMLYRYINESITIIIVDKTNPNVSDCNGIVQIFSTSIEGNLVTTIKVCEKLMAKNTGNPIKDFSQEEQNLIRTVCGLKKVDIKNGATYTSMHKSEIENYKTTYENYQKLLKKCADNDEALNGEELTNWTANREYIKQRVNLFIGGTNGIGINNNVNKVELNYSNIGLGDGFLKIYKGKKFIESYEENLIDNSKDNYEYDEDITGGITSVSDIRITYTVKE